MKSRVSVTILVDIEYKCDEHKNALLAQLARKDGLFGLSGAGATKTGAFHSYSITPVKEDSVVVEVPTITTLMKKKP